MTEDEKDRRIARLEGAIADAIDAMNRGEWGQVRRILITGKDKPVISTTGVIARNARGTL